jgi:hypothetical protein
MRTRESQLGEMPTTQVRRLISVWQPVERVGRVQAAGVLPWEVQMGQQILCGVFERVQSQREPGSEHLGDLVQEGHAGRSGSQLTSLQIAIPRSDSWRLFAREKATAPRGQTITLGVTQTITLGVRGNRRQGTPAATSSGR